MFEVYRTTYLELYFETPDDLCSLFASLGGQWIIFDFDFDCKRKCVELEQPAELRSFGPLMFVRNDELVRLLHSCDPIWHDKCFRHFDMGG